MSRRSVWSVRQGIDFVLARATLFEAPPQRRGVRYTPSPEGRLALGVPWQGGFEELEVRYRRERTRIAGDEIATGIETTGQHKRYRSELELPRVRWAAYALRALDDRTPLFDGTRGAQVAAMARRAVHYAAKDAGLETASSPSSWGTRAMGGSRRSPFRTSDAGMKCVDEDAWRSGVSRLAGAALVEEASGVTVGLFAPIAEPDPMLVRYRGEGRCRTSATPVILPGYDSLRGRARPERSVRRLLRRAGICEALFEHAALSRGPRLRGGVHPLSCRRPRHFERCPCVYVTVGWTEPVRRPLALGAGTGYGLGFLVPEGEEFLGRRRGGVEGS